MAVRNIGSNQTQVDKQDGTSVLVSYLTAVAAFIPGQGYVKTSTRHSSTTSKHVNKWLDGAKAKEVPQEVLDQLI